MNPTFKSILVISAKNALNALLTSTAFLAFFNDWGWLNSSAGWINIGKVALSSVLAREAAIWVPKLLAWSQSNSTPSNIK